MINAAGMNRPSGVTTSARTYKSSSSQTKSGTSLKFSRFTENSTCSSRRAQQAFDQQMKSIGRQRTGNCSPSRGTSAVARAPFKLRPTTLSVTLAVEPAGRAGSLVPLSTCNTPTITSSLSPAYATRRGARAGALRAARVRESSTRLVEHPHVSEGNRAPLPAVSEQRSSRAVPPIDLRNVTCYL